MSKFVPPQGYEDDYDTLDYAIQLVSNLNASGRIDAIERAKLDHALYLGERMMLEIERVHRDRRLTSSEYEIIRDTIDITTARYENIIKNLEHLIKTYKEERKCAQQK